MRSMDFKLPDALNGGGGVGNIPLNFEKSFFRHLKKYVFMVFWFKAKNNKIDPLPT